MKRAILAGLLMVCGVIYLVLLNGEATEFRLTPSQVLQWNRGALVGGAFFTGVLATLLIVGFEAGQRAFVAWRTGRRVRRTSRIDVLEESGERLLWNGEVTRGRALLYKAWQRRPDGDEAALRLAQSFRDGGELHRARGVLFDAATRHHTNPDILLALAEIHRLAGEAGPAVEALERARALYPRAPRVLRPLAEALAEARRWEEAATVEAALLERLQDETARLATRDCIQQYRYRAAMTPAAPLERLAALENLAERRGTPLPVLVSLGDTLTELGRADEASAVWERALRGTPRTILIDRLGHLASERPHRERIRHLLRKLRVSGEAASAVHLLVARLWLGDHETDQASQELNLVAAPLDGTPLFHRLRAEVLRQRGQVEAALAEGLLSAGTGDEHSCRACRQVAAEWTGTCPSCGSFDALRSATEIGSD